MTKDQSSDLRSYIDRIRMCTVNYERAEQSLADANSQLEQFIYKLEKEVKQ